MERGDIVRVELPTPPGGVGHEQAGSRPALIIHSDATSPSLSVIMIVPFTGQLSALKYRHTIAVAPSPGNGLTTPSVLLVFQLRAIDRARLREAIGRLEPDLLERVENEIRQMLGL